MDVCPLCIRWPWSTERIIQSLVGIQNIKAIPGVYWESQCKSCICLSANPILFSSILYTHLTPARVISTSWSSGDWRLFRWNPSRQPFLKVMTNLLQWFPQMPGKRRFSLSKTLRMNPTMVSLMRSLFAQVLIIKMILSCILILRGGGGVLPENKRKKLWVCLRF